MATFKDLKFSYSVDLHGFEKQEPNHPNRSPLRIQPPIEFPLPYGGSASPTRELLFHTTLPPNLWAYKNICSQSRRIPYRCIISQTAGRADVCRSVEGGRYEVEAEEPVLTM